MTPEQLQQYFDEVLKKREQFDFVFYPLVIVLSLGAAWLFSYLREKGKNLATKEDIKAITEIQEEIRTKLANQSHFSRVRYECEMGIYQKVWPKLMNFWGIILTADVSTGQPDYGKARNEMIEVIRENKPFFPKEIWQEVQAFQKLCEGKRFSELVLRFRELNSDEKKSYFESSDKIKAQLDKVEEAIRNRLSKFD
jgi:hypothetical protein